MKKVYSKPEILFEDFTLSTNIASCEVQVEAMINECTIEFVPGVSNLFLEDMEICDVKIVDGSNEMNNDGLCYHQPSPSNNIFNS